MSVAPPPEGTTLRPQKWDHPPLRRKHSAKVAIIPTAGPQFRDAWLLMTKTYTLTTMRRRDRNRTLDGKPVDCGEAAIEGKVVVITGATSGIGQIAAEKLAVMGARLCSLHVIRSVPGRTLARLCACRADVAHSVHYADLSRLGEMKRVGTRRSRLWNRGSTS